MSSGYIVTSLWYIRRTKSTPSRLLENQFIPDVETLSLHAYRKRKTDQSNSIYVSQELSELNVSSIFQCIFIKLLGREASSLIFRQERSQDFKTTRSYQLKLFKKRIRCSVRSYIEGMLDTSGRIQYWVFNMSTGYPTF